MKKFEVVFAPNSGLSRLFIEAESFVVEDDRVRFRCGGVDALVVFVAYVIYVAEQGDVS